MEGLPVIKKELCPKFPVDYGSYKYVVTMNGFELPDGKLMFWGCSNELKDAEQIAREQDGKVWKVV